jgi:hypothetical protein
MLLKYRLSSFCLIHFMFDEMLFINRQQAALKKCRCALYILHFEYTVPIMFLVNFFFYETPMLMCTTGTLANTQACN